MKCQPRALVQRLKELTEIDRDFLGDKAPVSHKAALAGVRTAITEARDVFMVRSHIVSNDHAKMISD